jgi:hypothetical protein
MDVSAKASYPSVQPAQLIRDLDLVKDYWNLGLGDKARAKYAELKEQLGKLGVNL